MIYLTGDTHGFIDLHKLCSKQFDVGKTLTKKDYVVVLGDFGLLWNSDDDELWWRNWLHEKPWTTLFVDGNHENHDMLEQLETAQKFGSDVGMVNESIFHLRRGRVYNIDGNRCFVLGGGESIDKAYRKEGVSYWPQELPNNEELELAWNNLRKAGMEVDYVFTHTCPNDLLGHFGISAGWSGANKKLFDPLTFHLQDISQQLKFRHWYFGHMHDDRSMSRGMGDVKFTCLYEKVILLGDTL